MGALSGSKARQQHGWYGMDVMVYGMDGMAWMVQHGWYIMDGMALLKEQNNFNVGYVLEHSN